MWWGIGLLLTTTIVIAIIESRHNGKTNNNPAEQNK
jgi:hypothetical protein